MKKEEKGEKEEEANVIAVNQLYDALGALTYPLY